MFGADVTRAPSAFAADPTLADGHPYVNRRLGCIGEVFLSTPTAGYVDPRVFAYPYPHPRKPVPVRYGYGFGRVRVRV